VSLLRRVVRSLLPNRLVDAYRRRNDLRPWSRRVEMDRLYSLLYDQVHDVDESLQFRRAASTAEAFRRQWEKLPDGEGLLSDPWFRDNVDSILVEQEILIDRSWFAGKRVLDAGCGNGRWSYGLARLGANVTSVDINQTAVEQTMAATSGFDTERAFLISPLETLNEALDGEQFDLVFCWGVAHHCVSYSRVIANLVEATRSGGVLYLYLYGRESLSREDDVRLFRERMLYNLFMADDAQLAFLTQKAGGDPHRLHLWHDIYAPLINRRFTFHEVKQNLEDLGMADVVRTIDHTELFIRARKSPADGAIPTLNPHPRPYWFERQSH
jgi:2-polyprenyl-3-methyl-5-hydroxy-6-metoxy-1,4-benzoquinol methylase